MTTHAITIFNDFSGHQEFGELPGVERDSYSIVPLLDELGMVVHPLRNTSKQRVLDTLESVLRLLKPGGRLLIYYSGHGETIHGRETILFPEARVSQLEYLHGALPLDLFRVQTESRGLSRLIINDSCRSNRYRSRRDGSAAFHGSAHLRDVAMRAEHELTVDRHPSTFTVLNSCSDDQYALDLGTGIGGLCTAALRELLRELLRNGQASTIDQSFVYGPLKSKMAVLAKANGYPTSPEPTLYGPGFELGVGTYKPTIEPVRTATAGFAQSESIHSGSPKQQPASNPFDPETVLERIRQERQRREREAREAQEQARLAAEQAAEAERQLREQEYESLKVQLAQEFERQDFAAGQKTVTAMLALKPGNAEAKRFEAFIQGELKSVRERELEATRAEASVPSSSVTGPRFTNSYGMEFVRVNLGTFMMGSPSSELGRSLDEQLHQVTLTRSFYMATTTVSQRHWKSVMGRSPPAHFYGGDLPVEQVAWYEAAEFCHKLSALEGRKYRLPTEAEWEYCCRAGTTTPFSFGQSINVHQANFDGNRASWLPQFLSDETYRKKTVSVLSFHPNAWDLYQMHGNVWEWCSDWYGAYSSALVTDPTGPLDGATRVVRGGSWDSLLESCRAACRNNYVPARRLKLIGFRVALDAD